MRTFHETEYDKQQLNKVKKHVIKSLGFLSQIAENIYPIDIDLAFRENNFHNVLDKIKKIRTYLEETENDLAHLIDVRNGDV